MGTIVAPNIDVVKRGILIGYATKLGNGLGGVSIVRNLSRNLALPTTIIRVVGIPQMVFTNLLMTTHVNMIANRPLMSLMVVGGCKSTNVVHPKGGYQEPIVVIAPIYDHRYGHYVKLNMVAFQYPDFKKDVDPYVHVRVFNYVIKQM